MMRRRGWEGKGGRTATKAIGPPEGLGIAPLSLVTSNLANLPQSPGFGCVSSSVSARRFVSWTSRTPLRVGNEVCLAQSTRDSALRWLFLPGIFSLGLCGPSSLSQLCTRPERSLKVSGLLQWRGQEWVDMVHQEGRSCAERRSI